MTMDAPRRKRGKTIFQLLTDSERNSHNTKLGKSGEMITMATLKAKGYDFVWKIATPCKPIYGKDKATGKRIIEKLVYEEKAPGDIWCTMKGRIVLVEVKTSTSDRIPYSELKPHQVANLNEVVAKNGIGILSVVLNDTAHLLHWPIVGPVQPRGKMSKLFQPGTSLVLRAGAIEVE